MSSQVPFTQSDILNYLDNCITFWRKKRQTAIESGNDTQHKQAVCYVDAYQSVRVSLFGSLKPKEE